MRCFSIAASILILAAGPAVADPQPTPPPPGPSPQPVPYPGDPQPPPPQCTNRFCIPQPSTGAAATHKHIGQVKYEDLAKSDATPMSTAAEKVINVESISWGELEGAGPVQPADPMEGGQVTARTYGPGKPTYGDATFEGAGPVHSADPMEGGQVTALHYRPGRQKAGSMTAVPLTPDQPPATTATSAKVKATFKTLAGACVQGVHLDEVIIKTRTASYTLHDALVTEVTPAEDGMETVTVSYASRDE